jgi:SAM-dependent methyltransferase
MVEVNRRAEEGVWKSALVESSGGSAQEAELMITNLERANWHLLLGLTSGGRVLDVGAGTGTNSHALASHYSEVVALEPVQERVDFMRLRFAQEGLSNIRIVRGSLWDVPFGPQSFDVVVMNGVLEWIAEGQTGDPGQLQAKALQKIYRLLKPGGQLYIGIENRLAIGNFIGYPDPHCRLPWVTILPRRLAHWYCKSRGLSHGYRNYLYSSRGYRKLLRTNGFRNIEIYVALPSYNHPRFLVPMRNNVFSHCIRNFYETGRRWPRSLAHRALLRSGALKYLEYSYIILASK